MAITVNQQYGDNLSSELAADLTTKVQDLFDLVRWMETYAKYMIGDTEFEPFNNP